MERLASINHLWWEFTSVEQLEERWETDLTKDLFTPDIELKVKD